MRWLFCVLVIGLSGSAAMAATSTTAASYLDVDVKQNRYVGEVQNSNQSANYTFLSGDVNLEAQSPGFMYKFNPVAEGALEIKDEFYFGVPEAYVQPRIPPGFNLTIGRQRRMWSHLDEEFNLGVWQPQLRWDYLAPRQEGLIGVFFDWSLSSNLSFSFFTSPLFLPDQGPNYQLTNGQFTSHNRWFAAPQSRLNLFSDEGITGDAPLNFSVAKPSEEAIVMHPSFGFGLHWQSETPFWAQINYAYKPRNQIHLGVECTNCVHLDGPTPLEINAVVHPVVVMHHVLTMESGFDRIDDRGWVSLTGDFPNNSGLPATYEESPLYSMLIAGAAYQHYVFSWLGMPSWLKYSYMQVFEIQAKDKHGMVESEQVQSSLDRYPYKQVAAVEWKLVLKQVRSNRLQVNTRYTYSIPEKGGWLTSTVDWAQGPLTYSLGFDILGSDVDANSPSAGLFTRYRSNDRFFGGINYVF